VVVLVLFVAVVWAIRQSKKAAPKLKPASTTGD
jgi:hypothetical protein